MEIADNGYLSKHYNLGVIGPQAQANEALGNQVQHIEANIFGFWLIQHIHYAIEAPYHKVDAKKDVIA